MPPAYFSRPDSTEHAPGFAKYIALVPEGDVLAFLQTQLDDFLQLLSSLTEPQALTLHAPYAWTLKQVLGHITDCERIFGTRALRLARNDTTPLPPFDENAYMQFSPFNQIPMPALLREFEHLRRSHIAMFQHFPPESWLYTGTVNTHPTTPRAMLYALAGHAQHHLSILHKRLAR